MRLRAYWFGESDRVYMGLFYLQALGKFLIYPKSVCSSHLFWG